MAFDPTVFEREVGTFLRLDPRRLTEFPWLIPGRLAPGGFIAAMTRVVETHPVATVDELEKAFFLAIEQGDDLVSRATRRYRRGQPTPYLIRRFAGNLVHRARLAGWTPADAGRDAR